MPKSLISSYQGLLCAQLNKRLNMAKFLSNCREKNSFMDNHFVETLLFLEEIQVGFFIPLISCFLKIDKKN